MTKERLAAIAAVLALAALGWGVLYRSMSADDVDADAQRSSKRSVWTSVPQEPSVHGRLCTGTPDDESNRDGTPRNFGDSSQRDNPSGQASTIRAIRVVHDVEQRDGTTGFSATENRGTSPATPNRVPGTLPRPQQASPVFPKSGGSGTLRSVIQEELPEATPQQIRIWKRVLEGVPPHVARQMLQLRRQVPLHGATPESDGFPVPENPPPKVVEDEPTGVLPRPPESITAVPAQWQASLDALKRAREVIMNNIANAQTPGFKRARVLFGNRPPRRISEAGLGEGNRPLSIGSGVGIAAIRRDWSNGRPMPTGRPLDWAIDGPGLFVLHKGGRPVYARSGHFTVDANGRIVLAGTDGPCVLDVSLRLSAGEPLHLLSGGLLLVLHWEWDSLGCECETIKLAVFRNPDALQPLGNGLFAETEASGSPRLLEAGNPNSGVLQQGYLEASNVEIQHELEELQTITRQKRALLQAFRIPAPNSDWLGGRKRVWSEGRASGNNRGARRPVIRGPGRMPVSSRTPDSGQRFPAPVTAPNDSD